RTPLVGTPHRAHVPDAPRRHTRRHTTQPGRGPAADSRQRARAPEGRRLRQPARPGGPGMTRVTFTLDSTTSEQLWPLVESVAYLFESVLGVDVVAAVDAGPAAGGEQP